VPTTFVCMGTKVHKEGRFSTREGKRGGGGMSWDKATLREKRREVPKKTGEILQLSTSKGCKRKRKKLTTAYPKTGGERRESAGPILLKRKT